MLKALTTRKHFAATAALLSLLAAYSSIQILGTGNGLPGIETHAAGTFTPSTHVSISEKTIEE
uniref:hypothetical protein n=1 Tax=Streptomyces sp. CA-141956 TaxID=3240051 RepID=UPI003F498693